MTTKTIAIMGCGWLGLPLAAYLLSKGHRVNGSTTTPSKVEVLRKVGVEPYLLELKPGLEGEGGHQFLAADVLVVNIPPRLRFNEAQFYARQMEGLVKALGHRRPHLIFISSTSVYPDNGSEVWEPDADPQHEIVQAEQVLQQALGSSVTVLRLGGLMGYDRQPGRYFAGKTGLTTGQTPVNYIHRDDAVAIIARLIEKDVRGEVYNAVSPEHPLRKEVMLKNAADLGFEPPEFVDTQQTHAYKIVNSDKLQRELPYQFIYQNPLDFLYIS